METETTLILASASERRVRLLSECGVSFKCIVPEVEESDCSLSPENTVRSNAELKNHWAASRYPNCAILSADTAISFKGKLIGKPASLTDAREQLKLFSGRTHLVLTGISCTFPGEPAYTDVCTSKVRFHSLDDAAISRYFSLVNPLDKAGSYDIGSNGEIVVKRHEGSLTNIIGLPMELVTPWLRKHGFLP